MTYKFLEHTADVKFLASGKTIEEAFVSCFEAMKETICEKKVIEMKKQKKIKIKADDLESLLYKFLEEFLFLLDSKGFLSSRIEDMKINAKKFELSAVVFGDDAKNYSFSNDVKAVTYNGMFVKKERGNWVCQVVLDV